MLGIRQKHVICHGKNRPAGHGACLESPRCMQRSILIVDDQTDILRILEREFRRRSEYSVATANSPEDALEVMDRSAVDLVISDVRLGDQTGFTLLHEVNQRHPGVGTMLMTAYRSPAYRQQAESLGVSYFLEKPFPVATLVNEVDRFFQERASAEEVKSPEGEEMNAMEHFKSQDLVQLFCLNGRNVRIALNVSDDKPVGYIYIQRGRVLHAEFGDMKGEFAFFELIKEADAGLSLQEWNLPVTETIQQAWEHLLLESARRLDHLNEMEQTEQADPVSPAAPVLPLDPPLAEPFADFWKVAQIFPK
jgi:DNA-binding response OmpR family regulator